MTTCLAVFTCHKGNGALLRHCPFFQRQRADSTYIITTENTHCDVPEGATAMPVGVDSYINGSHLPKRMLNTMQLLLEKEWDTLMLAEYDTVIFNRIQTENMTGDVAGHLGGGPTWGSKATRFYHNPWVFSRASASQFIETGTTAIEQGVCGQMTHDAYGLPESSPDVFFGYVCEQLGFNIQTDLWKEFSRNSFDHREDLELAKNFYQLGVDAIHGIKTAEELAYITC